MPDDILFFGATNLRSRTSPSGKVRHTIDVSGDSIGVNLDPKALGRPLAEAMAAVLRQRVGDITAVASEATLKLRKAAQRVFQGKRAGPQYGPKMAPMYGPKAPEQLGPKQQTTDWNQQRYAGGKMGPMEPNQSDKLFNDSGRFRESITVGANDDGWVINVAANRLDPTGIKTGIVGLQRMYARLVELVPEFGKPELLGSDVTVRRALKLGMEMLAQRMDDRNAALGMQRLRGIVGVGRALVGLGRRFG